MNIIRLISEAINPPPPDPRRYSGAIPYIPNFHGEQEGGKRNNGHVNDRVRIDQQGHVTFSDNSGFSGIEIPATLTDKDIRWLRLKRLDPTNPVYQVAKSYFSKHPGCGKADLAANSGMGVETAKDVIAGFLKNI